MTRVLFVLFLFAVAAATAPACAPAPAAASPGGTQPSATTTTVGTPSPIVSSAAVPTLGGEPIESHPERALGTPAPEIPRIAPTGPAPVRPIYLLDSNFTHFSHAIVSRIIAIDPDLRKRTIGGLTTRYLPDAAISPSGALIYVVDSYRPKVTRGERRDVLSIYRLGASDLVKDDAPANRRLMYKGLPYGEGFLFFSGDGTRLFLMKYGEPDMRKVELAAYDPATLEVLWEGDYPACDRRLVVGPFEWTCANSRASVSSGLTVSIDIVGVESGKVSGNVVGGFSVPGAVGVTGVVVSPDGRQAYFVTRDSTASHTVLTAVDLNGGEEPSHREIDVPNGSRFAYDQIVVSPDSERLYLGFGNTLSGFDTFSEVRTFDTATLEYLAKVDLDGSAIDLAISSEGDQLYVLSAASQTLAVYETNSLAHLGAVENLGGTPARILVPPGP